MPSLNARLEVAKSVGMPLIELEKHIDSAILAYAAVQAAAIEGRRKARLPLHSGQEGLEQLMVAAERLIAARKAVHDAHLTFRDVQDRMGVGPVSFGDYGDTPRDGDQPNGLVGVPALAIVHAA